MIVYLSTKLFTWLYNINFNTLSEHTVDILCIISVTTFPFEILGIAVLIQRIITKEFTCK